MVRKLELEIPNLLFERIQTQAQRSGTSPERILIDMAEERFVDVPELTESSFLLKYAGCIQSGDPYASDNERIDADLAKEYGNEVD